MKRFNIVAYQFEDGYVPYLDWYWKIKDFQLRSRITKRLDRVEMGNMGDCKVISQGVFELRIHARSGIRLYFTQEAQSIIILFLGGDKSTQKSDIQKAKDYYDDYQARKKSSGTLPPLYLVR